MELKPLGYAAIYKLDDLYALVNNDLKKRGKELAKAEPVSSVVNGKTVWTFEARDIARAATDPDRPKKKYNYTKDKYARKQDAAEVERIEVVAATASPL